MPNRRRTKSERELIADISNTEIIEIIDLFEWTFKDADCHNFTMESEISIGMTFKQLQILLKVLHEEYGVCNDFGYDL